MSVSIQKIQAPISEPMKSFEGKFKQFMKTKVMLLDSIMNYIVKRKGKQIRPMFVFLSAGMFGEINEKTHRGAALIELLHTATLVHDDVVDDANYRRGFFSINAIWKNKIAVLVGDYLLSKGLLLSVEHKDFEMLESVSIAVREIAEGELLQIEKARKLDITEEIYFEVIRKKTATLIAACCAVGAQSCQAVEDLVEKARLFGEKVGIAFQIKDDLFDYGDAEIGKPLGIDIKEKKMTLPLIHALQQTDRKTRKHIILTIKHESENPVKVREVIDFVKSTGGLQYATEKMHQIANEAREILSNFPPSEYRTSLNDLITYTIERNK
ncbi:polyprenyl synthetase family protein [Sandaracinomonas limnophila]|uniref:Polyprenyl synthetase family protein n=1 Tax=Sandaracinomonas limnophila TaxID=1862386 RepID=A0A437PR58_9BACT|nr:polyprenyl synthetase family protein [Sandaracinomonas limnophila]RVU24744.1 polyprenyl synthetase family protein [Sandaracinomonas limnophila]